jgi:ADP-ribosylglycohydrolase
MPYEGCQHFLDLTFYQPVPESSVANDDLDLQLVWLEHVKEFGLTVDSQILGQAWLDHIDAHPDEYGIAIWNLKRGIKPPLSGMHNNWFTSGMGAAIRSEIWASLFPGQPEVAGWYAFEDAQVDHAGDGIYAEIFLATMQSDLYVSGDLSRSIDKALTFLPDQIKLKQAILYVIDLYENDVTYEAARDQIKEKWGHHNFTDCVMNLCWMMLGLLYGEGDFDKSLLLAVNCGQDTDCTGATVGATLGILLGVHGIDARWLEPVGEQIVYGSYLRDVNPPASIVELVDSIDQLRKEFQGQPLPSIPTDFHLPKLDDVKDAWPWEMNGKLIPSDGLWIRVSDHIKQMNQMVRLRGVFTCDHTGPLQLMVVSPGIFRCFVNQQNMGTWGAPMPSVPAVHRVNGGRVFNIHVQKNVPCQVEIELYPTYPTPDVLVALTDTDNRYVTDISWQTPEALSRINPVDRKQVADVLT